MNTKKHILIYALMLITTSAFSQTVLTIDKAIELAMQQSPTMRSAQLNLKQSQERLNSQRAALKTNFSLDLSPLKYSEGTRYDDREADYYNFEEMTSDGTFRIEQPILPTDGVLSLTNTTSYNNSYSSKANADKSESLLNQLNLSLTQPLFTYNSLKLQLKELELSLENSYLNYGLQRLQIEQQVSRLFYQVYQNQQSLEIAKEELKNTQENYDIIKSKVEGGLQALEELYQAELNLASSQSSVQSSEVTLANSMDELVIALDLPFDTEIIIMANIEAEDASIELNKASSLALANRAELRQREIDIETSLFELTRVKDEEDFSGSIVASYGTTYLDDMIDDSNDNTTYTPSIELNLQVPIYDWGKRKADIRAQQASIDMTKIEFENEKKDIILNVRSTVRSLNNLRSQIDIQKQTLKNAELTYDINLERYKNGDLTGMDLSLYQNQLSSAKMGLTNAIIDYKLELLNLKVQTLYDFVKQESIVPEEFKMTMIKK